MTYKDLSAANERKTAHLADASRRQLSDTDSTAPYGYNDTNGQDSLEVGDQPSAPQSQTSENPQASPVSNSQSFACPFRNTPGDPLGACKNLTLAGIAAVRKHIDDVHKQRPQCRVCFQYFRNDERRKAHTRSHICSWTARTGRYVLSSANVFGVSQSQREELDDWMHSTRSDGDKWLIFFLIIFPLTGPPNTQFLTSGDTHVDVRSMGGTLRTGPEQRVLDDGEHARDGQESVAISATYGHASPKRRRAGTRYGMHTNNHYSSSHSNSETVGPLEALQEAISAANRERIASRQPATASAATPPRDNPFSEVEANKERELLASPMHTRDLLRWQQWAHAQGHAQGQTQHTPLAAVSQPFELDLPPPPGSERFVSRSRSPFERQPSGVMAPRRPSHRKERFTKSWRSTSQHGRGSVQVPSTTSGMTPALIGRPLPLEQSPFVCARCKAGLCSVEVLDEHLAGIPYSCTAYYQERFDFMEYHAGGQPQEPGVSQYRNRVPGRPDSLPHHPRRPE